jgi:hypothetical protein
MDFFFFPIIQRYTALLHVQEKKGNPNLNLLDDIDAFYGIT